MEWQLALLLIFGGLMVLMVTGMPVAFAFAIVNVVGVMIWWGGAKGIEQLVLSMVSSVNSFALLSVPLYILMGEALFQSGIAFHLLDAVDKWLGRLPGRLSLVAIGGGAILGTMSGTSLATIALLGTVLGPEMEKRGYKKPMIIGPIMASGGLSLMIPPSIFAVVFGAIAQISIGKILIAIIIPGLLMAAIYATYIILRCHIQPRIAPTYAMAHVPLSEKVLHTVRYLLPLVVIIFLVTGIIFFGVATPSEAAAAGTLGAFLLAAAYRRLNWKIIKDSFSGALRVTFMVFIIIAGATGFSQIVSSSGAGRGLTETMINIPLGPIFVIIAMQLVVFILGCFIDAFSIMMITLPIFMPIVGALALNPVWFAVFMMINLDCASITPPFGLGLFVMKGVAPPDTTMEDVYRGALPFVALELTAMALVIAFPMIALWLPGLMK